jgi:hypothetical protein
VFSFAPPNLPVQFGLPRGSARSASIARPIRGKNADAVLPIVHVLFSNVKTWLNGTFHGVSAKHLPRYAREWNYRFNRRRRIADLTDLLLRRAATRPTITYRQLVDGAQINGALPALTG